VAWRLQSGTPWPGYPLLGCSPTEPTPSHRAISILAPLPSAGQAGRRAIVHPERRRRHPARCRKLGFPESVLFDGIRAFFENDLHLEKGKGDILLFRVQQRVKCSSIFHHFAHHHFSISNRPILESVGRRGVPDGIGEIMLGKMMGARRSCPHARARVAVQSATNPPNLIRPHSSVLSSAMSPTLSFQR
jgi:hypothetical protein